MTRRLPLLVLALLAVLAWPAAPARAQADQRTAVSGAAATVERMQTNANFQKDFLGELQKARAVLIVPNLYKGGFILGGQYGNGVMLAHLPDGTWSSPAFYTVEGGSLGLQIGLADNSILFILRSDRALDAMLSSQFKFGADAGLTVAVVGAGMGAATTPNLKADILAYALSGVGLYAGLSLEGTVVAPRDSWNAAYYGKDVSSRAILLDQAASNPQADHLRDILAH
jgi:lipid-binding SYLF domain-containing protein